jgi:hypothetical protein
VLAIPIEDTLLYVEPIYLQAETAAYPELRLVAVMHNDDLSYAESFENAIVCKRVNFFRQEIQDCGLFPIAAGEPRFGRRPSYFDYPVDPV